MKYSHLPYLDNLSLPALEYQYARDLRLPLADAINHARQYPAEKMEDVIVLLEAALAHIRGETDEDEEAAEVVSGTSPDDVLDSLLGPSTEDEPDAG